MAYPKTLEAGTKTADNGVLKNKNCSILDAIILLQEEK